jgi:hypothetical protein
MLQPKKCISMLLIVLIAIIAVYSLWKYPILLICVLIVMALFKHRIFPLKREYIMYVISAAVGSISESIIMFGGPWSYAQATIVNFPIWLPFLWGLAGITGISLYQSISE